ncbi:MAG: rod shape-determining protein RodA [Chitinophagia bacterium]|jgi:rod shape determining protein RodA|nr:rod shape-determining protein RodA [Chitinophagia bacterium]
MRKNSPEITKGIDWLLVVVYVVLVLTGITSIFAATYRDESILNGFLSFKTDYSKQLYYFAICAVLAVFILLTDSKFFTATANIFYFLGIVLLILVFPFHTDVKGTKSIIRFSGFQLQPAELCKVFVNLALAKYLSSMDLNFKKVRSQLIASALILLPAILSILQSETGLALVYFSFFLVLYREGLPSSVLVIGFAISLLVVLTLLIEQNTLAIILTAIAIVFIYLSRKEIRRNRAVFFTIVGIWALCVGVQRFAVPYFFSNVLKPYQVQRIYATVGKDYQVDESTLSEADLKKMEEKKKAGNYNVKQSKIAIGSGGIFGKGLLKGTQTKYDFVPEQRTDFIFCTIGEGFGFLGSVVLLGLYLFMLFRIVNIAERQRSVFSRVYAYGVASVFFFHVFINIGMTLGIVPVIGIPLPFMSYGGTALITFSVLLFILIRLDADRQMILR